MPFRQTPDGRFLAEPDELTTIGLLVAAQAQREDGWIDLNLLPGVHTRYDEAGQHFHISTIDATLVTHIINVRYRGRDECADHVSPFSRDIGGYLNHGVSYDTGGAGGSG